jgi:hypothetical protein
MPTLTRIIYNSKALPYAICSSLCCKIKLYFIFELYDYFMEQVVHQVLINDIETLLAGAKGIDEVQAKIYRKTAEMILEEQQEHP